MKDTLQTSAFDRTMLDKDNRTDWLINCCREMQNASCRGWSFLKATESDGIWKFTSMAREMADNREWDDLLKRGCNSNIEELKLILKDKVITKYFDSVWDNRLFAEWANFLNFSSPLEVGELLWANTQSLIDDLNQEFGNYLSDLTILIQLYWQLKNIEDLGLQHVRDSFNFPEVNKNYLSSMRVLCEAALEFERLSMEKTKYRRVYFSAECNFADLIEESLKQGDFHQVIRFQKEEFDDSKPICKEEEDDDLPF